MGTLNSCAAILTALAIAGGCANSRPPDADTPARPEAFRVDPPPARTRASAGPAPAETDAHRPAVADPVPVDLSIALRLADVIRLAADRNPKVAAARARWQAAIEKHPQALSLPDPMVAAGIRYLDDRHGPQVWVYNARQEIPFPTKLFAQAAIADREAEKARLEYLAAIRDAVIDAQEAFHELAYLDRAETTIDQVRELLRRYSAFATGELPKGGTTLPETFRAQSQLAQLDYDRVLVRELRETERARLRSILRLTRGTPLGPAEPPPYRPVETKLEELTALAERWNEELRMAGVEVERAGNETSLARQSRIPDLALEVEVMAPDTGEEPDETTAMLGLTLPIWEHRNAARVREAEALREAAVAERMGRHAEIEAATARLYFRLSNAQRLVTLYRDSLIPQALQAMNAAEELFRAKQASFAATVETAATWYNFQLAYFRALADQGQATARLEQVLGTTAEPRRAGGGE